MFSPRDIQMFRSDVFPQMFVPLVSLVALVTGVRSRFEVHVKNMPLQGVLKLKLLVAELT